jgi:hypothetical protein
MASLFWSRFVLENSHRSALILLNEAVNARRRLTDSSLKNGAHYYTTHNYLCCCIVGCVAILYYHFTVRYTLQERLSKINKPVTMIM